MSQSGKSDPKKAKSKGKDKSNPVDEGPSAEPTEEVVSAVNQVFGIGADSSTSIYNKKTGKEDENVHNKASSVKNVQHQPAPVNVREDSDPHVRPEPSKVSTSKPTQSQANIRNVRDLNSGRILTRSTSEKLFDQKQQGSGNVSVDPTESVVSAVTHYFGIGEDEEPIKKIPNIHTDQIVATSQQVLDNNDSSNGTKKQTSSSKVPSTVTAKQKLSPETSSKSEKVSAEPTSTPPESTRKQSQTVADAPADDRKKIRKLTETVETSSKRVMIVPIAESTPSESVVDAVTDFFGISHLVQSTPVSKTNVAPQQTTSTGKQINDTSNNINDPLKRDDANVASKTNPDTVGKPQPDSSIYGNKDERSSTSAQPSGKKSESVQSYQVNLVATQSTTNPLLSKAADSRVTPTSANKIVPSAEATPNESVITAVTDCFGISHSVQSAPVSKTNVAPQQTTSTSKQPINTCDSMKDPLKQGDAKVPYEKTNPEPAGKPQPDSSVFGNKEEATRMIGNDHIAHGMAESKETSRPEDLVTAVVIPQDNKEDKKPVNSTSGQPLEKKSESVKSPVAPASTQGTTTPFLSKSADSKAAPTSANKIVPSTEVTPNESVITAVTDCFGISHLVQSAPVSKTNVASQQTTSTSKQPLDTRNSMKDPLKKGDAKVPYEKTNPEPVGKPQPHSPVFGNEENTSRMIESDQIVMGVAESKDNPRPEVLVVPVTAAAIPQDSNDREKTISSTSAQPLEKKSESMKPTFSAMDPGRVAAGRVETPRKDEQAHTSLNTTSKLSPPMSISTISESADTNKPGGASTKDPQSVSMSKVETPRKIDQPDTHLETTSKLSPPSGVSSTPVSAFTNKPGGTSIKNPQSVAASKKETPTYIDQPDKNQETTSKLFPSSCASSTPVSAVMNKPGDTSTKNPQTVAVVKVETPRNTDEPDKILKASSKLPHPSGVSTEPVSVDKPGDLDSDVLPTPPANTKESNVEAAPTAAAALTSSSPLGVESTGAGAQDLKVLATTKASQSVGANLVKREMAKDDLGQPDAAKAADFNVSPSRAIVTRPDVGSKKDIKKTGVSETASKTPSVLPMTEHPELINKDATESPRTIEEKPQAVATSKTDTSQNLDDRKIAESTKADSSSQPKRASVDAGALTGLSQPITDTEKNRGRSSNFTEDRVGEESSKSALPVLAGISQQPQPAKANAVETPRTFEGQRALGTTSSETSEPALSPGTGASTNLPLAIMNGQDRRPNKASTTHVPPSPTQLTNSPAEVSNTGSSALSGVQSPTRSSHTSAGTARQCWICFATDEDELGLHWIQPCKCRGTTKWVHQSCLQMWVDEKLREHKERKVACPQCRTEYLIYLPKANILVECLDQVDNVIYRVCPFIAAGVVIGSFYWNAVTYGAIVMLQVAGTEGAGIVTETFQPTVIIVGLPFIPLSLIVFRLFQWEDTFLYLLRTTSNCLPPLQYILPAHVVNETGVVADESATAAMSFQRVLAGALLTPVIAKFCGNLFFPSVKSPVWRTVFGGALFISVKGLIKMYHKQQSYKRLSGRRILDYTDENKRLIQQSRPIMISQVTPTPLRFQFVASVESRRTVRR